MTDLDMMIGTPGFMILELDLGRFVIAGIIFAFFNPTEVTNLFGNDIPDRWTSQLNFTSRANLIGKTWETMHRQMIQ